MPRFLTLALAVAASLSVAPVLAQSTGKAPVKQFCPVDGKTVAVTPQSVSVQINGAPRYFCEAGCRTRFQVWPEKYLRDTVSQCPVQPNFKAFIQLSRRAELNNGLYYLCCDPCVGWIRDKPWLYVKELRDPVSAKPFPLTDKSPRSDVKGQLYFFESTESKAQFDLDPSRYVVAYRR